MSRYRLYPSAGQEVTLLRYCSDARYVWNLAWSLYQCGTFETYGKASRHKSRNGSEYIHQKRRPVRKLPGFVEMCRQLTEARAEFEWLGAGSQNVQQQALRDFSQTMGLFLGGTRGYPGRRKKGRCEGFRITDFTFALHVQRLNRRWGQVAVPKIGWVRFRWSRAVPECKSYRVNMDRSGRWHVAFQAIPDPIPAPGTGEVVGIDRGIAVSLTLSTGEMYQVPVPSLRIKRLQRRWSRTKRGSNRREQARKRAARVMARDGDRKKDWAEKVSTDIARRFDVIRIEDLKIQGMTRSSKKTVLSRGQHPWAKATLNRYILAQGWGLFAWRLGQKAPGRVEKINPTYTSITCSACGIRDREARESQAVFRCRSCGHAENADVNAAKVIAAGRAVTARGGPEFGPANREPRAA